VLRHDLVRWRRRGEKGRRRLVLERVKDKLDGEVETRWMTVKEGRRRKGRKEGGDGTRGEKDRAREKRWMTVKGVRKEEGDGTRDKMDEV
jgi:hypothetical protein